MVIVSRSAEELETVRQDILAINKDINVLAVPTDTRSMESVAALWEKVKTTFGKADVLVNNAGTLKGGAVGEIAVNDWWLDFVRTSSEPLR